MLQEFCKRYDIQPQKIVVGVSGGADSLYAVLEVYKELMPLGFEIIALTVDHGLRPSSHKEAAFVADLMKTKGIEHHILYWEGNKPKTGVEEAARNARYELMEKWCEEHQVRYLITAHHLYDQVETFFMRLQRGSGLDGLCGMREITPFKSVYVLRPFLETNPQLFKTSLRQQHIQWIEDESNEDERLLRVKIRHFLPIFEEKTGIKLSQVGQTMNRLQSSRGYFDRKIQSFLKNHCKNFADKVFCCSFKLFCTQDEEIQYRLMAYLIKFISEADYAPQADKIFSLLQRLTQETFKSGTLGHCRIIKVGDFIWFLPEIRKEKRYSKEVWREYLNTHIELKKMKLPSAVKHFFINQ